MSERKLLFCPRWLQAEETFWEHARQATESRMFASAGFELDVVYPPRHLDGMVPRKAVHVAVQCDLYRDEASVADHVCLVVRGFLPQVQYGIDADASYFVDAENELKEYINSTMPAKIKRMRDRMAREEAAHDALAGSVDRTGGKPELISDSVYVKQVDRVDCNSVHSRRTHLPVHAKQVQIQARTDVPGCCRVLLRVFRVSDACRDLLQSVLLDFVRERVPSANFKTVKLLCGSKKEYGRLVYDNEHACSTFLEEYGIQYDTCFSVDASCAAVVSGARDPRPSYYVHVKDINFVRRLHPAALSYFRDRNPNAFDTKVFGAVVKTDELRRSVPDNRDCDRDVPPRGFTYI
jgi:hypothetical protein